jgi:hypothetical protein
MKSLTTAAFLCAALAAQSARATVGSCNVSNTIAIPVSDATQALGTVEWLVTSTNANVEVVGLHDDGSTSITMTTAAANDGTGNTNVILNGTTYVLDENGVFLGPSTPDSATLALLLAMNNDLAAAPAQPEIPTYCSDQSVSAGRCAASGVAFALTATISIIASTSLVGAIGGGLATWYALDTVLGNCGVYNP